MNKKFIIIAIVVVLALILAICALPIFSQLYYHRSQAATMLAWQLEKETYTTEESFQALLMDKRAANGPPYLIPMDISLSVSVDSGIYDGMQYYILNSSSSAARAIFYFPGGSFTDQPRGVHWQFLNQLASDTGAMIIVPIYPKLPDTNAAASYAAVLSFFQNCAAEMTWSELIFMGDSAGGGMALSLAMQLRDSGAAGPNKLILLSPWVDVTMANPDIPAYEAKDPALDSQLLRRLGELWADEMDATDPIISPLYGDFQDLGEITILTSKGELLYPDITALMQKLNEADIDCNALVSPGMFHVWPIYVLYSVPEVQESYEFIAATVMG